MGQDIPARFFMDLDDTVPVRHTFGNEGHPGWTPAGAMKWYDDIIDDLLANPGSDMTACAKRLGRSPSTVHTICASDLFKARWAQRRQQYEEVLNQKMVAKLTKVAELSLDHTITVLEKKQDAIPLPQLMELSKTALDRLGYSPAQQASASVVVNTTTNVVSADALAAAREKLKLIEGTVGPPREAGDRFGQGPNHEVSSVKPVAGPATPDGED